MPGKVTGCSQAGLTAAPAQSAGTDKADALHSSGWGRQGIAKSARFMRAVRRKRFGQAFGSQPSVPRDGAHRVRLEKLEHGSIKL